MADPVGLLNQPLTHATGNGVPQWASGEASKKEQAKSYATECHVRYNVDSVPLNSTNGNTGYSLLGIGCLMLGTRLLDAGCYWSMATRGYQSGEVEHVIWLASG